MGTAEPCLFDGALFVPKGTGMFSLSTDFPSVKTLGYFQETQTLNRYATPPSRRQLGNLPPKYIWPRDLRRFVLEGTTSTMKKLIILTPLLAAAAVLLTSCTTVVEKPAPTTTTTTTHSETVKHAPSSSTETTVRSSGNY